MFQINDQSQINAMNEMSKLMQNTGTINQYFAAKKLEFNVLVED